MTLFLTASSFYSIFTQVPKTFNSTVALQVGFLKHLGDIQSWSKISAPLVDMNKEGYENESALLILLIFYLKKFTKI